MGLPEMTKAYEKLAPAEQALFAAFVRAHQLFINPDWQAELARRHSQIDSGRSVGLEAIEELLKELETDGH